MGGASYYPNLQWARDLYEEVKDTRPGSLPPFWDDDMSDLARAHWLYKWRVEQGILPKAETPEEAMALAGLDTWQVLP